MDLVRSDLLPPILIRDLHRAARRQSLVDQAAPQGGNGGAALARRLGAMLVLLGCLTQAAGQRLAASASVAAPAPCGRRA